MWYPVLAVIVGALVVYFHKEIKMKSIGKWDTLFQGGLLGFMIWFCLAVIYFVGKWMLSLF